MTCFPSKCFSFSSNFPFFLIDADLFFQSMIDKDNNTNIVKKEAAIQISPDRSSLQIIRVDSTEEFDWSPSVVLFIEVISSINVNW